MSLQIHLSLTLDMYASLETNALKKISTLRQAYSAFIILYMLFVHLLSPL